MTSDSIEQASLVDGAELHQTIARSWSSKYDKKSGFRNRLKVFRSILASMSIQGQLWLDAGCGSGVLTRELGALGASVVALDASPEMIGFAREEAKASDGDIHYQVIRTIEYLPQFNSDFDGILCSSVLEYVSDPRLVILGFAKVTRPGGYLLLTVPNTYSPIRIGQKIIRFMGGVIGFDFYRYLATSRNAYDVNSLRSLLADAGFTVSHYQCIDPILNRVIGFSSLGSLLLVVAIKSR